MNTDLIAHAVMIAENLGAPVFPVIVQPDPENPGKMKKSPLIKAWQKSEATNAEAIEELFRQRPHATHVGILTGAKSRILAVDLDGEPGLQWWREHTELLPVTRTQRTQRPGGKHLLYRIPAGCGLRNTASKVAPGVDIRADDGFIVDWSREFPPEIEDLADAPLALIEFLKTATAKKDAPGASTGDRSKDNTANGSGKFGEGQRHAALTSHAGVLRRWGLKGAELEGALMGWNAEHCDPPQDRADVIRIVQDFSKKEGNEEAAAEPLFDASHARIGIKTFTEIQPPPSFVIDGILPVDVGVLSAPGGSSKSTFQLWRAIHIILKRPFLGRQVLKPGRVLIISAEDPLRRIRYRAHHTAQHMDLSEQDLETLGENLLIEDMTGQVCRLAALSSDGNLYQTAVVNHLVEAYKDSKLSLAVLDPYVFFGPGERLVNDGDSIMAQVGARLVRELGSAVEFIAHSGKANAREGRSDQYASRGGSALPDGMRCVEVLTVVSPKEEDLPASLDTTDVAQGRILRLHIPKITDAPPIKTAFYIQRTRFGFEWLENITNDAHEAELHRIQTLQAFIEAQLKVGVRHTRNTLNARPLGMKRDDMRNAVHAGVERGFLIEKELPKTERRGRRESYLIVGAPAC